MSPLPYRYRYIYMHRHVNSSTYGWKNTHTKTLSIGK